MSLPAAATLPYTYKSMPSTLPAPTTGVTGAGDENNKPKYVVTPSAGYAAHPDEIVASCREVRARLARRKDEMEAALARFHDHIRDRDLAEKRRVAPGWLDSDARLLEPEGPAAEADAHGTEIAGHYEMAGRFAEMSLTTPADRGSSSGGGGGGGGGMEGPSEMAVDQGAELDRAFGDLK